MIAFTIISFVPVNLNYLFHFAREKKERLLVYRSVVRMIGTRGRITMGRWLPQWYSRLIGGRAINNGDSRNIFTSVDGAWFCDAFDSLLGMV